MELTHSFVHLLAHFSPVFTEPTFLTFTQICSGWILSHRHRYITDIIFSGGNVRDGHWCRFHRFFSDAAWDIDRLNMLLAILIVRVFYPTGIILIAVDDTLTRKRGLTIYGAGMHYDPLISSRSKKLVSWGHDWVVLSIIVVNPFWASTKVFALPIAQRLYRNRQGLTKGKKKTDGKPKKTKAPADHRTRPQLAMELVSLVSSWFPNHTFVLTGDSAYGGKSILSKLPANVHLISHVHCKGALYAPLTPSTEKRRGAPRKKGPRLPTMTQWANDESKPWETLKFDQFGLHATLEVKTQQALYYTAGGTRLLTIVLTRDTLGKRPMQMFYCTDLTWDARKILSTYASRWAIECTFENCKQFLGLEDAANRVRLAVTRTAPMALFLYSMAIVWFHEVGQAFCEIPDRPWYRGKTEPSFADILSTLRRESLEEKTATLPLKKTADKRWLARIIDLLCRTG